MNKIFDLPFCLSHKSLLSLIFIQDTSVWSKKCVGEGNSKPAIERLCKVRKARHKNVKHRQKDFATHTRHINVKTVEVGFCNVRPNTI